MKQKFPSLLVAVSLAMIILTISCKKEPINKITAKAVIYQYGTNTPVEGVIVDLYKRDPNCFDFINGCSDIYYRFVTSDANGDFETDNQTTSIRYHKIGYFYEYAGSPARDSTSIFYIRKTGWAKFHITNPDARKIDTVLRFSYSKFIPSVIKGADTTFQIGGGDIFLTINKYTDTTIISIQIADAENHINMEYDMPLYYPVENITDSFYVKDSDTAHVDIKIQ